MENKENITPEVNKITETLSKELESLSPEGLHEFFQFFYKMNHAHGNMIHIDQFEEFLEAFDNNPFKTNEELPEILPEVPQGTDRGWCCILC
jgi:hypothetical protein